MDPTLSSSTSRSNGDIVAMDPPLSSSTSSLLGNSRSQVLGSSVHFPDGQSEAPRAEHCPAQLAPWPQVATSGVLSGWQQVTLLIWLEDVKASSKKSTEGTVVVFPGHYCLVFSKQNRFPWNICAKLVEVALVFGINWVFHCNWNLISSYFMNGWIMLGCSELLLRCRSKSTHKKTSSQKLGRFGKSSSTYFDSDLPNLFAANL